MSGDSYPKLPQDLERLIFERVALDKPRSSQSATLLLVAKRVREWIRPILYRVFIQITTPPIPDLKVYPSLQLPDVGKFVQHLIIGDYDDLVERILSSCPHIYDLAFWVRSETLKQYMPIIQHLPLTRLSSSFEDLTADDFLGPIFFNITHLDIVGLHDTSWDRWEVLTKLPKLTHVAINFPPTLTIIRSLLRCCGHLHVLVLLLDAEDYWVAKDPKEVFEIQDDRLVLMVGGDHDEMADDWMSGADGLTDFWITAELFATARRCNFLLDSSPRWIKPSLNWTDELNNGGKEWYLNSC
ncbi:hypothetical protein GALMADRAFT_257659 [Galerina marginata CBS 339.88]|uniref:F-box domain-containing protein n=1 Tax=Galerina marginata (strain CBS 339.88) TaxID=685588 RepID=A0A067SLZ5_GALM3|nr:hypothetical protein GALMADRAFT_257659 [Galerina marginata CBS 339.88]